MRHRTLLAAAVAVLLVVSGCTALPSFGESGQSPPDVDVVDRYESLESLEAVQKSTIDYGNTTNGSRSTVRIDFTSDPPRQFQRVREPADRAGDVTVVNDSGALIYDASDNSVTRVPQTETRTTARQNRSEYFARIVAAARSDEVAEPSSGVSPLPVVPATGGSPIPADAIEGFDVEYLGTQTVADRTAHGFEMTATSEAALSLNQTLWLDSKYYYPLKTHQVLDYGNRTIETTTQLTSVTFNTDLSDDAFEFSVPEDATVDTLNISTQTFDTVAELRDHTELSVPDPEVPDGYEFQQARLFGENVTEVNLRYANGDGDFISVSKMDYVSNGSSGLSTGENVTVAGHDGQYLTTGQSQLLMWSCEDRQYSVVSTNLDREHLVAVAESIACE
ncbi:LolA family protein [Halobacterium bonnevillei]|uniref:DUF4367 domain-containing protein n=1 Tax=Halobacterium bonnevillei TaxID=2692200 RepID=A0A6B0SPK7_9EURY|nr:DUF4367 domain-containing protein [Halobacterium bonnevillei]MXR21561.1 DUF4367 domain-containing protein [Halobacterium bonnevillei]